AQYDVAFADPPYATDHAARLADLFRATPFARVFSIEHAPDRDVPGDDTRRYCDTAITFVYAPRSESRSIQARLIPSRRDTRISSIGLVSSSISSSWPWL